jgi:hypothetical protein
MPTLNGRDNNAIADEHTITGYKRYDPKHNILTALSSKSID